MRQTEIERATTRKREKARDGRIRTREKDRARMRERKNACEREKCRGTRYLDDAHFT